MLCIFTRKELHHPISTASLYFKYVHICESSDTNTHTEMHKHQTEFLLTEERAMPSRMLNLFLFLKKNIYIATTWTTEKMVSLNYTRKHTSATCTQTNAQSGDIRESQQNQMNYCKALSWCSDFRSFIFVGAVSNPWCTYINTHEVVDYVNRKINVFVSRAFSVFTLIAFQGYLRD